jgi:hypothetical protein
VVLSVLCCVAVVSPVFSMVYARSCVLCTHPHQTAALVMCMRGSSALWPALT